jgi:hypothetical protein
MPLFSWADALNKDILWTTTCCKAGGGIGYCHAFVLQPAPVYLPLLAYSSGHGGLSLADFFSKRLSKPTEPRQKLSGLLFCAMESADSKQ